MSWITEITLIGAHEREVAPLNAWLLENDERGQQFQPIDMDAAGGNKYYVSNVWAAAFNYGPMSELLPKLRDPETWGTAVLLVAVVVRGEDDDEAFVFGRQADGTYAPVTARGDSAEEGNDGR